MKIRDEKGSMAVYVTIVLVSMLFILMAIFLTSNNLRKNQIKTALKVKETYEADNGRADEIYDQLIGKNKPDYAKEGLILHYDAINNTGNGHDNSTTIWKDLSGNGNDLKLSNFGNNEKSGWSDYAINFDGVDDFGTISTISQYLQGDVTISTRIYSKAANNYRGIYGNHVGTNYGVSGILAQYQENLMRIGYNGNIVDIPYDYVTNKEITLTVQMGTNIGTKVYINGKLVGEIKTDSNPIQPETEFWIGKSYNSAERYFLGTMNNFLIYNRLLTENEINEIYKANELNY